VRDLFPKAASVSAKCKQKSRAAKPAVKLLWINISSNFANIQFISCKLLDIKCLQGKQRKIHLKPQASMQFVTNFVNAISPTMNI